MSIDFSEKCKKLKEIIIASYDWDGESSFDERLAENLAHNKELRDFYEEHFGNIWTKATLLDYCL